MKNNNILVAVGGHGIELETAKVASKKIKRAITKLGYNALILPISDIVANPDVVRKVILVYVVAYGGIGENGGFQAFLEENNVPFTGSISSVSALCKDKYLCKKMLAKIGIPTPDGFSFDCLTTESQLLKKMLLQKITFPIILKPRFNGGSSVGIQIVTNHNQLKSALCEIRKFDNQFILEKYIYGDDYIAGGITINGISHIFPIGKAKINKDQNFADRFSQGKSIFTLSKNEIVDTKISKLTERINLFLEITGMSYIDFRVDYNDNPYFIEIGTMYGISDNSILPLSAKAEGKEFTDLVNYDIGIALKRKQNNEVV